MSQKLLTFPYALPYATSTQTTIGLVARAQQVSSVADGGFYCSPRSLPPDFDPSYPSDLNIWWLAGAAITGTDKVVRLHTTFTRLSLDGTTYDDSRTVDITLPSGLAANTLFYTTLLDAGDANTFPGHYFSAGDALGLRAARIGSNPADTYPGVVKLATDLELRYHQRCQAVCCCN